MHRSRSSRRPRTSRLGTTRHRRTTRLVTGAVLVVLTLVLVLGPVLGLVGAAAGAGPLLDVPYAATTAVVLLALLAAAGCLVGTWRTRSDPLGWTLVVLAVLLALFASVWPLVTTADAAVDGARDVVPWIARLVRDAR